jgi:hypothetical protein
MAVALPLTTARLEYVRPEEAILRQLWNSVVGRCTKAVVYVPDSEQLPMLWPRERTEHPRPNLSVLSAASTEVLTALCDNYWNSFLDESEWDDVVRIRDSTVCRRALDILGGRGSEAIRWARSRLTHPGYDAREEAACLLGVLAAHGQLGSEEEAVAAELASSATRPWQEDTKEIQANTAAMIALHMIGGEICFATMRQILTSPEWDNDDAQWDAASILSDLTGQPFMEAGNPVQAAKDWLRGNP